MYINVTYSQMMMVGKQLVKSWGMYRSD